MTYHYRIYTFKNGLDETVFRAKPIYRFLPQWATRWVETITFRMGYRFLHSKWDSRDGVISAIEDHAKDRASAARFAKQKTLKLVVMEDVPVEVSGK